MSTFHLPVLRRCQGDPCPRPLQHRPPDVDGHPVEPSSVLRPEAELIGTDKNDLDLGYEKLPESSCVTYY